MNPSLQCDVVVIGGGIGGLWAHNRLLKAGYRSILLEARALGSGQTLASQGFVQAGLNRPPGSGAARAAEIIGAMPGRWAACLAGRGELDLSGARLATRQAWLWSSDRQLGDHGNLLTSQLLRGRARRLPRQQFPDLLRNPAFRGVVYALDDLIIDVPSTLRALRELAGNTVFAFEAQREHVQAQRFPLPEGLLETDAVVLAAGAANAGLSDVPMRRMVSQPVWIEWPRGQCPGALWGHSITGVQAHEPRLTIGTHHHEGRDFWYLGGALATRGGNRSEQEQIDAAIREVGTALPWVKVPRTAVFTRPIETAIGDAGGAHPEEPMVVGTGQTLTCWSTRLALAPAMADAVIATLPLAAPQPGQRKARLNLDSPAPGIAARPWLQGRP